MFFGKMKALTFSYDDGVTQDRRLIEILNKYSLKATFNINSELLGKPGELLFGDVRVSHCKVSPDEVQELYSGHEVAVHTLTHPSLTKLDEAEIIRQTEEDRLALGALTGSEIVGMAYPGGGVNNDERVARIIEANTGIKYARTIESNGSFEPQSNLMRFNPTAYHLAFDALFALGRDFLALRPDSPKLFYIWGHSYEFDISNSWDKFEEFCSFMAGHDDIFYGTNSQVLLGEK